VGGERLRLLQPRRDLGPVEKYLGALAAERSGDTILIVVDDAWIYPPHFVQAIASALLEREAQLARAIAGRWRYQARWYVGKEAELNGHGQHRQPTAVAVGGSGVRWPDDLSAIAVAEPGIACELQLRPRDVHTAVFGSALPPGCHKRVDSLQGLGGIAFRRASVDLHELSALAERAPPFLRYVADDCERASERRMHHRLSSPSPLAVLARSPFNRSHSSSFCTAHVPL
jgi:hypothetical protein